MAEGVPVLKISLKLHYSNELLSTRRVYTSLSTLKAKWREVLMLDLALFINIYIIIIDNVANIYSEKDSNITLLGKR